MALQFEEFDSSKDLKYQREMFTECFPEAIGTSVETKEFYFWKFHQFPTDEDKKSFEYIAKENNEILGYYAAIPYQYKVNDKIYKAAMVCDVMTGIKARGKGIFVKLGLFSTGKFKECNLAFSTGFPIRPEVIPGHLKAGWKILFEIPMLGKFITMGSFLKTRKLGILIPFSNGILRFSSLISRVFMVPKSKDDAITCMRSSVADLLNDKELDRFFAECKKSENIYLDKTREFMQWRLGAPGRNYEILLLKKDQNVVGYCVLRKVIKENVPCLAIMDIEVLRDYLVHTSKLLRAVEEEAKRSRSELILIMIMEKKARDLNLYKNGYMKTPYKFSFILKKYTDQIDDEALLDESKWNLKWIDSDDL